jgi:glucosamine--fructose-6-phosphate aminotransferase (isomerizing)
LQVLGRGLILGAVLEMALKIKETTGVFTQGMSSADFLHGPLAAVDPDLPVLLVDAGGPNSPDIKALDARLRSLRADLATCTVGIGSDLPLPEGLTEALSCLPITIRGQQLAYEWAVRKGRDPDAPVGLSKVTATF